MCFLSTTFPNAPAHPPPPPILFDQSLNTIYKLIWPKEGVGGGSMKGNLGRGF